ncbi:MAG: hypothetical protein FWD46_03695 [Cystobacterineae bacterium]|nr:hypothetical protein [Cystobacterineae bacterium]
MQPWKIYGLSLALVLLAACDSGGGIVVGTIEIGENSVKCALAADGTPCDNGKGVCEGGACVAMVPEECEGATDGEPCDNGICSGGICVQVQVHTECESLEEGTPCDNGKGVCEDGVCVTTTPDECEGLADGTLCNNDDGVCEDGVCVTTTPDECEGLADGTLCNNDNGVCEDGVCVTTPPDECEGLADGTLCNNDNGVCEDGVCVTTTPDECEGLADGTLCNNDNGVCEDGVCVTTPPDECEGLADGTLCNNDNGVCEDGVCVTTPPDECEGLADGTLCNNDNGVCEDGVCVTVVCMETPAAFCQRMARDEGLACGEITANDNCGTERTEDCGVGACVSGTECDTRANRCISSGETPSNDMCAGAAVLTPGTLFYGDTSHATLSYGDALSEVCRSAIGNNNAQGPEVVYSYTPTAEGQFLVRVTSMGNYDPLLWMTEEDCGGDGSACTAASWQNGVEELEVAGDPRITYYFYVDSRNTGQGTIGMFSIEVLPL